MKAISFSDIRFVERLIDGVKIQTTRHLCECAEHRGQHHQVGDRVKLMFKQRSIHKFYCGHCETGANTREELMARNGIGNCPHCGRDDRPIVPKYFADATIAEVTDISMCFGQKLPGIKLRILHGGVEYSVHEIDDFAVKDGFDDTNDLENWFYLHDETLSRGETVPYKVYRFKDIEPTEPLDFHPTTWTAEQIYDSVQETMKITPEERERTIKQLDQLIHRNRKCRAK